MLAAAIHAISLQILRRIIPDFDSRVVKHGGRILKADSQLQFGPTNIKYRPETVPETVFISRLVLEEILREYVQTIPTVEVIQGLVTGVTPDNTGQRIERVTIQTKGVETRTIEVETALFADCSGPATIGIKLLEKAQGAKWGPYSKTTYGKEK